MLLARDGDAAVAMRRNTRKRSRGASMDCVNPCCSVNTGALASRDLSCVALCDMRQEVAAANLRSDRKVVRTPLRRGMPSSEIANRCLRQARPDIRYHRPLADDTDRERGVLRLLSIPEPFEALNNHLSTTQGIPNFTLSLFGLPPTLVKPSHPPSILRGRTELGLSPLKLSVPILLCHFHPQSLHHWHRRRGE